MNKKILILSSLLALFAASTSAQTTIELRPDGGYERIPATVNGLAVRAFYTEEAWNLSLSPTTFRFMQENGYISYNDVRGNATLRIAGEDVPAITLVIKTLKVGNLVMRDLPAALIRTQTVPMLIGPGVFSEWGTVVKDGDKLLIGEAEVAPEGKVDSLRTLAQNLLDSGEYAKACEVFDELYKDDHLNMFTFCQYCLTLSLANRYEDNIAKSEQWLEKYSGLSAVSDFWIYDAMGDSAYGLEKWEEADAYYAKAFETQCNLYNTNEKAIENGEYHDADLGKALFMRSRAQAHLGKLRKSERWALLSARLGYEPAVEFCEKYGIK